MIQFLDHYVDIPILESDRLILRPLNSSFISGEYVSWMNDEEVIRYMDSGGNYTLKKLKNYIEKVENNPQYFWAIIFKNKNKHIGNIKIDPIDKENKYGEYGIMIGNKNFWRKGIAAEASSLVIKFCFERICLRKINLGVLEKNKSAIKLYQKLGFLIEGNHKQHTFRNGVYENLYRMAKLNPKIK